MPAGEISMKVLMVIADSGVYYTNNPEHAHPGYTGVKSYQYMEMSEEEYNAIPATEEAAKFFQGKRIGQRPKDE